MKKKLSLFLSAAVLLTLALIYIPGGLQHSRADSSPSKLSGYAWSSNIGWLSMEGSTPYGVKITYGSPGNPNIIEGSAWSSNIGWINFDPVIGSGGDALPSGATDPHGVWLEGNNVTGWARACSVFASGGCSGDLKDNAQRGGWDGWIKMNSTGNPTNDVHMVGNELQGYAWGSDVIGWIDFCSNSGTSGCVSLDTLNFTCGPIEPIENDGKLDSTHTSLNVAWEAVVTNGNGTYTYDWTFDVTPTADTVAQPNRDYTSAGPHTASVTIEDGAGKKGSASCQDLIISEAAKSTLFLSVVGNGTSGNVSSIDDTTIDCDLNTSCPNHIYDLGYNGGEIILTGETPASGESLTWTGCDSAGGVGDMTCGINTNHLENWVTANYGTAPTSGSLTAVPPGLLIDQQADGVPAKTIESTITWIGTEPTDICFLGSVSERTGRSIADVNELITVPANNIECWLGGNEGCVGGISTCVNILPGAENAKKFYIRVKEKKIKVRSNSPYFIDIGQIGGAKATLYFEYTVPDINDE